MKNKAREMAAPIIVTAFCIIYYAVYFGFLISAIGGIFRVILGVVPLILSALTVKVCIDRIKEIKKGENDDISKY